MMTLTSSFRSLPPDGRRSCSPYEAVLGEAFGSLHAHVRRAHLPPLRVLLLQASLGAFDTLYYHEYRLKLAQGAHTRLELRLHASRDSAYAIIIGSLGLVTWLGALAWVLRWLLFGEICITLAAGVFASGIRDLIASARPAAA